MPLSKVQGGPDWFEAWGLIGQNQALIHRLFPESRDIRWESSGLLRPLVPVSSEAFLSPEGPVSHVLAIYCEEVCQSDSPNVHPCCVE